MTDMKRLTYILTILMLAASCTEKENDDKGTALEERLCKEWHSCTLSMDEADIYMSFSEDLTFELYQKIGEGSHRLYRGTWTLEGNVLSGKYNDGEDWGASYEIAMSDKFMTMTSKNDAAEENIFEECTIPEEVKESSLVVVRSHAEFTPAI